MNKICETCDTKNRLGLCDGKDGDFKYCYRKAGSLHGLSESITPFNTIEELYKKIGHDRLNWIDKDSLYMVHYYKRINLLLGSYIDSDGKEKECPVGYIIK